MGSDQFAWCRCGYIVDHGHFEAQPGRHRRPLAWIVSLIPEWTAAVVDSTTTRYRFKGSGLVGATRCDSKGPPGPCEGEASRWLGNRVSEAKLAVRWHFELNPHALVRMANHAMSSKGSDSAISDFQRSRSFLAVAQLGLRHRPSELPQAVTPREFGETCFIVGLRAQPCGFRLRHQDGKNPSAISMRILQNRK
jgi:hypothetical protein